MYQAIQVIEFDRIRRFPICKNNTTCHRRIDLAPEMPTPSSVAIRMVLPLPLLHFLKLKKSQALAIFTANQASSAGRARNHCKKQSQPREPDQ